MTTFAGDEDHGDDITSGPPDDWDEDSADEAWVEDGPWPPAVVDVDVRGDRL